MKKILTVVSSLLLAFVLIACSNKPKLKLYVPNDYTNKDLIRQFEKENNVRVKIITFNSNEVALGNVRANSYDVVVPSDYAIEELAKENLLEKIDFDSLVDETFELAPGLEAFLNQLNEEGFNFKEYSVPYFWGSLGILYNNNKISKEEIANLGFSVIGKKDLNTVIYDSSRDALMVGLNVVGKKLDEATQKDIDAAKDWLISAKRNGARILSDEILTDMLKGTPHDAVIAYSGDAVYIMDENSNYDFYIPENTNMFADGFVVPKNAKNKELAFKFIKFMTTKEAALANTLELGYTAARKDVFEQMLNEDFSEERIKLAYESKIELFQIYRYDIDLKEKIEKAWELVLVAK